MKNYKLFFWVILIQVFILNNIQFSGYVNPYYYIIFIITLPPRINKLYSLIISLLLGLIIDLFSHSHGMHAFCCLLIIYFKIIWTSKKDIEENINVINFSLQQYILFIIPFIFIHHFSLFFLERFSIKEIFPVIKLTISSAFFTGVLLIIHKLFILRK